MPLPQRRHSFNRHLDRRLPFLSSRRRPLARTLRSLHHFCDLIPQILPQANDCELFDHLMAACPSGSGASHSVFVAQNAERCLSELAKYGLKTQHEAIEFLGSYYRSPLGCSDLMSDYDVGIELLQDHIFCHLDSLSQKFHLLIQMIHKLYAFVSPDWSDWN